MRRLKVLSFIPIVETMMKISKTIIFHLIKFATLIMNSVGVKAKKIYQIKGEIPDEFIPKNIFNKLKL